MDLGKLFTDDPQGEELSAGEDGNDGGEKWEARHAAADNQITAQDVRQHADSKQREEESHNAGKPERPRAVSGHHVDGVRGEFDKSISRAAPTAGVMADPNC